MSVNRLIRYSPHSNTHALVSMHEKSLEDNAENICMANWYFYKLLLKIGNYLKNIFGTSFEHPAQDSVNFNSVFYNNLSKKLCSGIVENLASNFVLKTCQRCQRILLKILPQSHPPLFENPAWHLQKFNEDLRIIFRIFSESPF